MQSVRNREPASRVSHVPWVTQRKRDLETTVRVQVRLRRCTVLLEAEAADEGPVVEDSRRVQGVMRFCPPLM